MKICCTILFIISFFTARTQSIHTLTTDPIALLHPVYPALTVGITHQKALHDITLLTGILIPHQLLNITGWDDKSLNRGFTIRLRAMRKLHYQAGRLSAGPALRYIYNHYTRTDQFDASPQNTLPNSFCSTCITEKYHITKHALSILLRMEYTPKNQGSVQVKPYLSVGITLISNNHSKNTRLHYHPAVADGMIHYYLPHQPGQYIYPLPVISSGVTLFITQKKGRTIMPGLMNIEQIDS